MGMSDAWKGVDPERGADVSRARALEIRRTRGLRAASHEIAEGGRNAGDARTGHERPQPPLPPLPPNPPPNPPPSTPGEDTPPDTPISDVPRDEPAERPPLREPPEREPGRIAS